MTVSPSISPNTGSAVNGITNGGGVQGNGVINGNTNEAPNVALIIGVVSSTVAILGMIMYGVYRYAKTKAVQKNVITTRNPTFFNTHTESQNTPELKRVVIGREAMSFEPIQARSYSARRSGSI